MSIPITADLFKLKSPCADCPFRKTGGVRHGVGPALAYASYFTLGLGATFPCHRSVPEHLDRSGYTPWQDGQQFCAGGLAFAENVGRRSLAVQRCIDLGAHDPATLTDRDAVFASLDTMITAHREESQ